MSKVAVYPGSFDPITSGHADIIHRISDLFDEVIVLIAKAPQKQSMFTPEERKALIEETFSNLPNVKVDIHEGLTVQYMNKKNAKIIVRGLRAVVDYEYELTMANMNRRLEPSVETMLVYASPQYSFISSRGVKEVAANGGKLEGLVPPNVAKAIMEKMNY